MNQALYVSDTLDETFLTTPQALMYGMLQSRLSRGLRNNIIGVNKKLRAWAMRRYGTGKNRR